MSLKRAPYVAAIVAARGESKGIPRKNLADFCGKPLIAWTIEQALAARGLGGVWCHALDRIEELGQPVDLVCALQATSPLREPADLERALDDFSRQDCDSLFSASPLEDFLIWERTPDGSVRPVNYDPAARGRRREREVQFVENRSFYMFRPDMLRSTQTGWAGGSE